MIRPLLRNRRRQHATPQPGPDAAALEHQARQRDLPTIPPAHLTLR